MTNEPDPLDVVRLRPLMERTRGNAEIAVAVIDGPVATTLPAFRAAKIRDLGRSGHGLCNLSGSVACEHGTFLAGMFVAAKQSPAPGICPECTLILRPIFSDPSAGKQPTATADELAAAVSEVVNGGAKIINLSLGLSDSSPRGLRELGLALDDAAHRGAIVVAAAGNHGLVGGSALTRHCGVIAVTACDLHGAPLGFSNYGASIGRRGLAAPGAGITSLSSRGLVISSAGTSVAAPFVSGAIALLWSQNVAASAERIRSAILSPHRRRRPTIVPPILDAWRAHEELRANIA